MKTLRRIGLWLAGLIVAALAAYQFGRKTEDHQNEREADKNDKEGMKRALETDNNTNRADAVERLRRNKHLRD